MDNCLMDGSVSACSNDEARAGGFFGYLCSPLYDFICYISCCRNKADVLAKGKDNSWGGIGSIEGISAGGIVGSDQDIGQDVVLRLNSCVNEGAVEAWAMDNDNSFAGGIVGCHDSDGSNVDEYVHPYVYNCLNRGVITVKGGTGYFGAMDGLAGGIVGYGYDDDTTFRNCVDDGELSSDDICAHISGKDGSYDSKNPCWWTKGDGLYGIYEKEDMSGYNANLSLDVLNAVKYDASWIMRDGHLDLNIIF